MKWYFKIFLKMCSFRSSILECFSWMTSKCFSRFVIYYHHHPLLEGGSLPPSPRSGLHTKTNPPQMTNFSTRTVNLDTDLIEFRGELLAFLRIPHALGYESVKTLTIVSDFSVPSQQILGNTLASKRRPEFILKYLSFNKLPFRNTTYRRLRFCYRKSIFIWNLSG